MKKKLLGALFGLMFVVSGVQAGSKYEVLLTSYTIASDTTTFDAQFPNIAGRCDIDKLIFCTTATISTPILIGVYENATSTTAAGVSGVVQYFVLSGTNTTNLSSGVYELNYPYYNPLHLTNPAFFKADGDVTHRVYMNVNYR